MKIKRISREKTSEPVYNFHCIPDENYYANGILVHNCYKSNGGDAKDHHLSLEEFKIILSKMPKSLTQIAFGICDVDSNKDFWKMMEHSRSEGVIPNYTCNGLRVTDEVAKKTSEICGSVAVSIVKKKSSIQAVKRFVAAGCKQVNIHYMLSNETLQSAYKLVDDVKNIEGFKAIVFLGYKPKGRTPESFTPINDPSKFSKLMEYCEENDVGYGFDSCSCPSWYQTLIDSPDAEQQAMQGEPCESGLFSSYINCHGKFFPCSFTEGQDGWTEGVDVLECENFLTDVWMNPRVIEWRQKLIMSTKNCNCKMKNICRACPSFNVTPCKNDIA